MATVNRVTEARKWLAEHQKLCATCHAAGRQADKLCDEGYQVLLAAIRAQNAVDERARNLAAGQDELFTLSECGG